MEAVELKPELIYFETEDNDKMLLAELPEGFTLKVKNNTLEYNHEEETKSTSIVLPYKIDDLTTINFNNGEINWKHRILERWVDQTEYYNFYQKGLGHKDKYKNYLGGKDFEDKENSFLSYIVSLHPEVKKKQYLLLTAK